MFSVEVVCDCEDWFVFSWIIQSRWIQVWSFCNHVLCASGLQLGVEANRLVGASSGYRYAFKAMLSTSFFCGYGPACIFGNCVLWLFHVLFLWTWCCIHSLEIVFSDCSNSSMEFYRTSLCERHSTGSSTKESFGRSLKWMQRCIESNTRDIFLLWIWSCIDSLEIVFCDCSMLCRGCPWTWNGCIENWVLVSVEVACDCKDWFVFSMIIQNFWTSAEDGWLIPPALGMCGARLL